MNSAMSLPYPSAGPAPQQAKPAPPERQGGTAQHITFTVGNEEYGVDIMDVREIKGWTQATRLPNSPDYVRGVINLRGTMVPIFDLRARFGGGTTEASGTHVVVIVTVGNRVVGILVDAVSDILTIDRGDIQPVPRMDGGDKDDFIGGLVTIGGRMVALLTLDRMFGFEQRGMEFTH
jgi:purine-binding chemotaxis protein CheW